MNRSYSKIRHIQESNIKLEKKFIHEHRLLTPEDLNSQKGIETKKWSEFFNKHYGMNLPVDGNWKNPEFNKTMEKYLKEKNIPVWVCKKGDGYCSDEQEGEITTKEINALYDARKQDELSNGQ